MWDTELEMDGAIGLKGSVAGSEGGNRSKSEKDGANRRKFHRGFVIELRVPIQLKFVLVQMNSLGNHGCQPVIKK